MRRLPLHPRLARVVLGARGSREAAAACAALSEGWLPDHGSESTTCDLLAIADRIDGAPQRVRRAATEVARRARRLALELGNDALPERERESLLAAVFAGYPDRLARRRSPGGAALQLASGPGAELAEASGVREATFLVAVDLRASKRRSDRDARVRVASEVDAAWIRPTRTGITHEIDPKTGKVRAFECRLYEKMELDRKQVNPDPECAARMLCAAMLERGVATEIESDLRRMRFAGLSFDLETRLLTACRANSGWFRFDPIAALAWEERRQLNHRAPEYLDVPSGRKVRLDYVAPGEVQASVKLQELFGLARTPRIGDPAVAVTLRLLAPNGRPVQTTRDLRSFWENTYAEVRKQLRGRYPKHPWPEDPWNATPTARTKRRGS
jgi:ATP-dependent helicase HrpB